MDEKLREDLEYIIDESGAIDAAIQVMEIPEASLAIATLAAMGIVLTPWLARQRKIKQQRKHQCRKYQGLKRKQCMINLEIDELKKEKAKVIQSGLQCNKIPDAAKKNKCKQKIKDLVTSYDIKISKQRRKIG
jgi:hypothetical protein